jgi:putative membrane protein
LIWETLASYLPHVTASLNAVSTILLAIGLIRIKHGQARKHKAAMLAALTVSMVFLACYLLHKVALYETTGAFNKPFPRDESVAPLAARYTYFAILFTHLPLAILVPFLALRAIYLAMKGRIVAHKKLVKWAFPIWMYVSVTGVLVYLMLYQLYPTPTP